MKKERMDFKIINKSALPRERKVGSSIEEK